MSAIRLSTIVLKNLKLLKNENKILQKAIDFETQGKVLQKEQTDVLQRRQSIIYTLEALEELKVHTKEEIKEEEDQLAGLIQKKIIDLEKKIKRVKKKTRYQATLKMFQTILDSSKVLLYKIKIINFKNLSIPIILQEHNGPCPLIAICNILLLRNEVELRMDKSEVTEEELLSLVANRLKLIPSISNTNQIIHDSLPRLAKGLCVNLKFHRIDDLLLDPPCAIFVHLAIPTYHGWIVDPEDRAAAEAFGTQSYDDILRELSNSIEPAAATRDRKGDAQGALAKKGDFAEEHIITFLGKNATQLTSHGLISLRNNLEEGKLCMLFRNNHFHAMLKFDGEIYLLVTDIGYMEHPEIVWEKLGVNDSSYYDGDFKEYAPDLANDVPSNIPNVVPVNMEELRIKMEQEYQKEDEYFIKCHDMAPPTIGYHQKLEREHVVSTIDKCCLFDYVDVDGMGNKTVRYTVLVSKNMINSPQSHTCAHRSIAYPLYPLSYKIADVTYSALIYAPFKTFESYLRSCILPCDSFVAILRDIIEGLLYLCEKNYDLERLTIDCLIVLNDWGRGAILFRSLEVQTPPASSTKDHKFVEFGKKLSELCRNRWIDLPSSLKSLFKCMGKALTNEKRKRLLDAPLFLSDKDKVYTMLTLYQEVAHRTWQISNLLQEVQVDLPKIYEKLNQSGYAEVDAIWNATALNLPETLLSMPQRSMFFLLRFARNIAQHFGECRSKLQSLRAAKKLWDKKEKKYENFDENLMEQLFTADANKFDEILKNLLEKPHLMIPPGNLIEFMNGIYPNFIDWLFEKTYDVRIQEAIPLIDQ